MSDRNYSGADWLARSLEAWKKPAASPLGNAVADLLGDVVRGIYHIDERALHRVEWDDAYCIEITMPDDGGRWATWDFDLLTGLVVLAHERCIRVSIGAATFHYLKLYFHQRSREGGIAERHPTIEEAVERWRKLRPEAAIAAATTGAGGIGGG